MKRALLAYTLILFALLGEALFTSRILSQADVLLWDLPWSIYRPPHLQRPSNALLTDQTQQGYPNLFYSREAIRRGRIPLWNPHILAGMTFVGNMQSAMFFPLTWIAYLLAPLDAVEWICFFKLLIAGLGAWAFCFYALRTSWLGSFAAGMIFMLGSFNTAWLFYPISTASALVPWTLLATYFLFTRGWWVDCLLLAVALALLLLAGHPETAFHTAAGLILYGAYQFFRKDAQPRRKRIIVLGIVSILLSIALSAVQVFPFLEALRHSLMREERSLMAGGSAPLVSAVMYLMPNFYGNPSDGFYRGLGNWNEHNGFAGVVTLFLAAVAAFFWRTRTGILVWIIVCLWCLLMIFGIPPISWIFFYLPLFKTAANGRLIFLYQFGVAVLAACGIDLLRQRLSEADFQKVQRVTLWSALFLMLLLTPAIAAGMVNFFARSGPGLSMLFYFARQICFFYLTLGVILFLMRPVARSLQSRERVVRVLVVTLFCELFFLCAYRYNPVIPKSWAFGPEPECVRFLRSQAPERYTSVDGGILIENVSQIYGIFDSRGYDFPPPDSFTRFFRALVDPNPFNSQFQPNWTLPGAVNSARIAGIRYYLSVNQLMYPGLRLVYDRELKIYEDTSALPRSYLTGNVRKFANSEHLLAALRAASSDSYPAFNERIEINSPEKSAARIVRYDAEYVRIEAQPRYPALLVLTDTFFPGWKAIVDGRETEVIQTNMAFRGIALQPGRHVIEFFYRPWPFHFGKWLSSASWALTLLALLFVKGAKHVKKDR
ncbi:MAG TPA: YfhO family protein [Acidobacteriota bacterium]